MIQRFVLLIVFSGLAVLPSCKQGEGEVCQVNSDCSSGLVCNQQTGLCQGGTVNPTIDAPMVDSPIVDAAIDAPDIDAADVDAPSMTAN